MDPGNSPNSVCKEFLLFSSHSSFPCKQFDLDVNHQEMLWWDKCSGLCRGHAKLYSRGGRTWGYPHGCLSPEQRVHRPHSSTGQDSLVSLCGTHSCVQDRHTCFCLFFPCLTKHLSVLSRSKPPCRWSLSSSTGWTLLWKADGLQALLGKQGGKSEDL